MLAVSHRRQATPAAMATAHFFLFSIPRWPWLPPPPFPSPETSDANQSAHRCWRGGDKCRRPAAVGVGDIRTPATSDEDLAFYFFAGSSLKFCCHLFFLLDPPNPFLLPHLALFCWNQCTNFLLPPSSDFAGSSLNFCCHRLFFGWNQPILFCFHVCFFLLELVYQFFASTVFDFCWNQSKILLPYFLFSVCVPIFATTIFWFCWNRQKNLLPCLCW